MRITRFEKLFLKEFLVEYEPALGSIFPITGGKRLATGAVILECDSFKVYLFPNSAPASIVWEWVLENAFKEVPTIVVEIVAGKPGYELHTETDLVAHVHYNLEGAITLTPPPSKPNSSKGKPKSNPSTP